MTKISSLESRAEVLQRLAASTAPAWFPGKPPTWSGGAKKRLSLGKRVHNSALKNLLSGFTRDGKVLLNPNARPLKLFETTDKWPQHAAAWAFTFEPPEDVKTLWNGASRLTRRQIEKAEHKAFLSAVSILNEKCQDSHQKLDLLFALFPADRVNSSTAVLINMAFDNKGRVRQIEGKTLSNVERHVESVYFKTLSQELESRLSVVTSARQTGFTIEGAEGLKIILQEKAGGGVLDRLTQPFKRRPSDALLRFHRVQGKIKPAHSKAAAENVSSGSNPEKAVKLQGRVAEKENDSITERKTQEMSHPLAH